MTHYLGSRCRNPAQIVRKKIGYRGKLEKFDLEKGRKIYEEGKLHPKPTKSWVDEVEGEDQARSRRRAQAQNVPSKSAKREDLLPPTHKAENEAKPALQRKEPIWSEAIFGVDVVLREYDQVTEFTLSFGRITQINRAIYTQLCANDDRLHRKLTLEMLNYYTVVNLWVRLLDIKAKRGTTTLSETECDLRRYFTDKKIYMLQPVYTYLRSIGNVIDKRGKQLYIENHDLPTTVYQGRSGYHSTAQISADDQYKYKELPTLGILGDLLMASSSPAEILSVIIPNLPKNSWRKSARIQPSVGQTL
ncbi:hypothetical protein PGB90_009359 [Kerria lacca]